MGRGPQAMAGASSRAPSVTVLLHQNRAFFPGTGASCSCRGPLQRGTSVRPPTAPLPQGIETTPFSSSSHFGTLLTHLYAPQKLLAAFILITHCPDFCNASHIRWSPLQPQQIYYCEISNSSCRFPKSLSSLSSLLERAGLRPQARQEICVWCAWANSALLQWDALGAPREWPKPQRRNIFESKPMITCLGTRSPAPWPTAIRPPGRFRFPVPCSEIRSHSLKDERILPESPRAKS